MKPGQHPQDSGTFDTRLEITIPYRLTQEKRRELMDAAFKFAEAHQLAGVSVGCGDVSCVCEEMEHEALREVLPRRGADLRRLDGGTPQGET